ncbi:hypothetical protein [Bradyrhizobium sp. AUGA SZCCT0182]|uniref:hypothetical protein n=1 Tax=Bradyrhizobium sp. AUGA SZCCT0182 TaxID=2807667 RepID=UPI001BADAF22|nr:hypothetical protein [Bradyrhizobium sp. AUGA SZCCT0182]MBR1235734.1 hypothetical protein [Bradyrhizobium sp. AUGA SZCCT0182]
MTEDSKVVVIELNARRLQSDAEGFARLGKLHEEMSTLAGKEIRVNMSRVNWMDGHLASAFAIVALHAKLRNNAVRCMETRPNVRLVLQKNGLFRKKVEDRSNTAMPVRIFGLEDGVAFSQYARLHLSRSERPQMSAALENKFYEGVDELFANSALHSRSQTGVVVCGQFYPRMKLLDFSIVDGGRTIAGSLRESGIVRHSDSEAIEWAVISGNTTRQGDIPGGLGLKVLRDFIRMNSGKLTIVSGSGLWSQSHKGVIKERLTQPFPGTSVVLEINTSDEHQYDFVDGPNPTEIW